MLQPHVKPRAFWLFWNHSSSSVTAIYFATLHLGRNVRLNFSFLNNADRCGYRKHFYAIVSFITTSLSSEAVTIGPGCSEKVREMHDVYVDTNYFSHVDSPHRKSQPLSAVFSLKQFLQSLRCVTAFSLMPGLKFRRQTGPMEYSILTVLGREFIDC